MPSTMPSDPILAAAFATASAHDGFGSVESSIDCVRCSAKHAGAPAHFELQRRGDVYWVRMVTSDRWLSESVEGQILEGDPLDELLEEELADLGWRGTIGAQERVAGGAGGGAAAPSTTRRCWPPPREMLVRTPRVRTDIRIPR